MKLNEHRWGEGDRRVLLIHGIGSSGATWWQIGEGLEDATVIAPDLRGHGESPAGDDYSATAYASDLGDGYDLVVGHSLGGLVAAYAATRDPGFAKRLLLLDPVLDIEDEPATFAAIDEEADHPETAEQIAAANPHWHPEHARVRAIAGAQANPEAMKRTMRDNSPWRHAQLLERLTIPTHVFLGPMCAGARGNVSSASIPGTGHSLHRDRPELVIDACR